MTMKSASAGGKRYDPMQYWNEREHPNTAEDPGVSQAHAEFLEKFIGEADEILEIGPGVGRLFPLYRRLKVANTIDISRKYAERLRRAAKARNVPLNDVYLDGPTQTFPFSDRQFPKGVASFVFLHVPFENIRHTMSEMARVCSQVAIITGVDENWPKSEAERTPTSHCFNHDYRRICSEIRCEVVEETKLGHSFGLVYRSA